MKRVVVSLGLVSLLAGCASASPLDILIPTRKPTAATGEYLGHLYPTNACNGFYHSLSDTKFEKALVPLRKAELEGLAIVAKGELDFIDATGSAVSNGAWALIVAGLASIGIILPSPLEKKRVIKAGMQDPEEFRKGL